MKKLLFIAIAISALAGCTKSSPVVCAIQDSVVSLTSAAVTTELACKNLDAVKATLTTEVAKLNLCVPAAPAPAVAATGVKVQSAVGDAICGPVITALMGGALAAIPAEWGCTGGVPADQLKTYLTAQCQKAL